MENDFQRDKSSDDLENMSPERKALLKKLQSSAVAKSASKAAKTWPTLVPRNQEKYPSLLSQEGMWFLEQLRPQNASYYIPVGFRIRGQLDLNLVERCVGRLIARHESLRTRFVTVDGKLMQTVGEFVNFELDRIFFPKPSEGEYQDQFQLAATDYARKAFNLLEGPLIRVGVMEASETDYYLMISMHHIVSDASSLNIFYKELSDLYQAGPDNLENVLPALSLQLIDYAVWQRSQILGDQPIWSEQLDYWRRQLASPLPTLEVHPDRPRDQLQSFDGAKCQVVIPTDVLTGLKQISGARSSTVFMALLGIYYILLHRYTSQTDLLVGTPYRKREFDGAENAIGLFLNMLVLRGDITPDLTFHTLLDQVRDTTLSAYENSDVPYELLINNLLPNRDFSRAPFVQTILQYSQMSTPEFTDCTVTPFHFDSKTAQFDIALQLYEETNGIRGHFEYNTDIFDDGTIRRMSDHFVQLAAGAVENPDRPIGRLDMLSPEEKQSLVRLGTATWETPEPSCDLCQLFDKQAFATPDAIALKDGDVHLTYEELRRKSNVVAQSVFARTKSENELVGICLDRSIDMVVAILGVLKAGSAYLPVDRAHPKDRIDFILDDADVKLMIAEEELLASFNSPALSAISVAMMAESVTSGDRAPDYTVNPENLAYVMYTSGSTGKPKGVRVTHSNVVRLFEATDHWFHFNGEDVWSLFHSYAFDLSVWEMWGAYIYGGKLVVVPYEVSRSPVEFYSFLKKEKVTSLTQTPSAFRPIIPIDAKQGDSHLLDSLKCVVFAGEALDIQSLAPWFDKYGDDQPRMINMYGITETTVHVTFREIRQKDLDGKKGSVIGVPIPDLSLHLVDRQGMLVPIGVPGEMLVGGSGVAKGYLNREELTAERFTSDTIEPQTQGTVYHSGDLARRLPDGDIEFLSRIDHQVKIRGFRIEIGEIESSISEFQAVEETVVMVHTDEEGEKQLVAYLVSPQELDSYLEDLKAHLNSKLPDYMVPPIYMQLEQFPLTQNGKLDRRKLPEPKLIRQTSIEFVAPGTETEKAITDYCLRELKLEAIGVDDNLFELGLSSLQSARVFTNIEENLGVRMALSVMFKEPTVRNLARAVDLSEQTIDAGSDEQKWMSLVELRPGDNRPAIYFVHAAGGNILEYKGLVERLSQDYAVFGFQAQGLDGNSSILASIESMATFYLDELTASDHQTPFAIAGNCMGGSVALEMAKQLKSKGQTVPQVILFESINGEEIDGWSPLLDDIYVRVQRSSYYIRQLRMLPWSEKISYLISKIKSGIARVPRWLDMAKRKGDNVSVYHANAKYIDDSHTTAVWEQNEKAAFVYKPKSYDGEVLLLKQYHHQGMSRDNGWETVVSGGLETRKFRATPQGLLLEPALDETAREINRALAKRKS